MLNSLSSASRDEVVAALSAAVRYLSPHPAGDPDIPNVDPGVLQEVLQEVARRTKTRVNDERGRGYQLRYLSDELSRVVLPKNSGAYAAAAARLGERGDLHPSLYELEFSEPFDLYSAVPRQMARQVIQGAQSWQHLNPPGDVPDNFDLVSLFARTVPSASPDGNFTVLIVGTRNANRIVVHDALYLFHDVIDVSLARNTFDLLVAFVEVFGSEQTLAGQQLGKLVPYRRLQVAHSWPYQVPQIDVPGIKEGTKFKQTLMVRFVDQPRPAVDIAIAFTVNLATYASVLRRHGVALPDEFRDALEKSG